MTKKIAVLSAVLGMLMAAGPVMAVPGLERISTTVRPSSYRVIIPSNAIQVADGVFSLGSARDPQSGKMVEGYAFVRYKEREAKRGGGAAKASVCYGYLAKGAKWKTLEPWVVNPENTRGLVSDFVLNNLSLDISKWEDAADGVGGSYVDILGPGSSTTDPLEADMASPDGKNEVYFADISNSDVIAMTIVWGYFSAPIPYRQLIEWDQVYDDVTFDWSAETAGVPGKMDFENIATHELGHSVGMNDLYNSQCLEETMYGYAGYGEIIKRDLNKGDITGINLLY